jgi:hypothetical protein
MGQEAQMITHMFWAYGSFNKLEMLCARSFLMLGYDLHIWTYGDMSDAPSGAIIRDAREIIPESSLFLNRRGSYAGFSDWFRYAVICKHGGLYVDADVFALIRAEHLPKKKFLVTERVVGNKTVKINGNCIFNPQPTDGDVLDLALAYSSRFRKTDIDWCEIGPDLLTAIVGIYPNHKYDINDPDFANPINWWDCPSALMSSNFRLGSNVAFIHLYSAMWKGVDRNSTYPKGSLMQLLEDLLLRRDFDFRKIVRERFLQETKYAQASNKPRRNEVCPCGSGRKFKKCCGSL